MLTSLSLPHTRVCAGSTPELCGGHTSKAQLLVTGVVSSSWRRVFFHIKFWTGLPNLYPTNNLKKVSIQTLPRVWPIFLSIQIQFNDSGWEAKIQILASGQEWPKVHRLMWGFLIVLKPWAHYPFILPSRVAHRLDKAFCLNFWEIGCLCMILVT